MQDNRDPFRLSTRQAIRILAWIVVVLVAMDLAALGFTMWTGHDYVLGLLSFFDLNQEMNPGTLFSVTLFLLNASLFRLLYLQDREETRPRPPWNFLSMLLVLLALDEGALIHERIGGAMKALGVTTDVVHFVWTLPYGILALAVAAIVVPTLWRVGPRARRGFLLSGFVYVAGAWGGEVISGWWLERIGGEAARPEIVYELMTTAEELLEMAGLILLTYTLLELLRSRTSSVRFRLEP